MIDGLFKRERIIKLKSKEFELEKQLEECKKELSDQFEKRNGLLRQFFNKKGWEISYEFRNIIKQELYSKDCEFRGYEIDYGKYFKAHLVVNNFKYVIIYDPYGKIGFDICDRQKNHPTKDEVKAYKILDDICYKMTVIFNNMFLD